MKQFLDVLEIKTKEILNDFDTEKHVYFTQKELENAIKNIKNVTVWISQEDYILTFHIEEKIENSGVYDLLLYHVNYHLNYVLQLNLKLYKWQYTLLSKR